MTGEPSGYDAGLTGEEARRRLATEGPNELPSARPRSPLAIALDVLREPMILLLLASGSLYLLLGDPAEAIALLLSIFLVVGITLFQRHRSERALEALRALSTPRARVVRDGNTIRVPSREVVRGDLLVVHEGERITADARVESALNLSVDESLLTGESVPVGKRPGSPGSPSSTNEDSILFSGTLVVAGQGTGRITATGPRTQLGRIGRSLATIHGEESGLQRETRRVVRLLAAIGIALCVVVVVAYGLTRGDWLQASLAGLTLAIAILPEEMPVILTVFLAVGAWRISRRNVLARQLPAIESMGSATVLCVDKTGTLTVNRMSVEAVQAEGHPAQWISRGATEISREAVPLVESAILASRATAVDPMERAFTDLRPHVDAQAPLLAADRTLAREYPLTPNRLAVTNVWRLARDGRLVVAAKGAPETIAALCSLSPRDRAATMEQVDAMASAGLRVLGVAASELEPEAALPDSPEGFSFRSCGLVGLADPLRPAVPEAIRTCREAGIRVVMITGDHPVTARNIARQAGLLRPDRVATGAEIDVADDAGLGDLAEDVDVFARVRPEQKLRIVRALKARGGVVAMTGDGVNDAPALQAADIGIAMGERGTDVAREAADLVLLDDDFSSLVNAIRLGRRIEDNLKHAMSYVIAIHVPIAAMSLTPILLGWPLILLPVHVIMLEMVIDPACSIAFEAEPERPDVMRRRPRSPGASLFDRHLVGRGLQQGIGLLFVVLGIYAASVMSGGSEGETRALTFTTLVLGNLALITTNRSRTRPFHEMLRVPNAALWWVVIGAVAVLAVVLYVPPMRELFRFSTLHPPDLLVCVAGAVAAGTWFEILRRRTQDAKPAPG